MCAHAGLKNDFTEDEKYHNLMSWLKSSPLAHSLSRSSTCYSIICFFSKYIFSKRMILLKYVKVNDIFMSKIGLSCSSNFNLAISWDFGTFCPPLTHSSNTHAQPSSGARCLNFGRTLRLLPYFMCTNSEGSGSGSPEPWLGACVISTIISWAGSFLSLKLAWAALLILIC